MTTTYTRVEIAQTLGKSLEEVAIRKAGSYSTHIAINGTSYCGRINNDGYNVVSDFEKTYTSTCGTCVKRYESAAAKVVA